MKLRGYQLYCVQLFVSSFRQCINERNPDVRSLVRRRESIQKVSHVQAAVQIKTKIQRLLNV